MRPSFVASTTASRNSSSLNPLHTMGMPSSPSVRESAARSSGLVPTSRPNPNGAPMSRTSSQTCRAGLTLTG